MLRFLLIATLVLSSTTAAAHKRFARKLGVECKECHQSPEGGGPRNLIGQYYQATAELPLDRAPQTMKLVESTVDRWLLDLLSKPPTLRWRHQPLEQMSELPARTYAPASESALLRRLSLDLRGAPPSERELDQLLSGQRSPEALVEDWLQSKDFESTFFLYHKDIIRPRTGIFFTPISFTRVNKMRVNDADVYASERLRTEASDGDCARGKTVDVSPWWDRKSTLKVCARTASPAMTAVVKGETLRCDSDVGQKSGGCGCGPNLLFCYADGVRDEVMKSMKDEMAWLAMTVVKEDRPYSEILTADWTMVDGKLEVFYGKLWGDQRHITDPDGSKPWRRIERDPRHSGVLTSPPMFNFFYNGRRWAQRTLESFFCHETTPDFDLLDDTIDAGHTVAVPYRDSPDLMPTQTVTEGRACAACHLQLDAVSRLKDRWDYFGAYHENMPGPRPLPIPQSAMFEGSLVDGVDGLGKALAASPVFHDCVVNQAWEHMTGHRFRPDELQTRRALVGEFTAKQLNFKDLLRSIIRTPEYRSMENVKLMKKEQYVRAMGRATDVAWKVAEKSGWELYYDKIGGMDYRKIEFRDVSPGIGHSLVQFKGAGESCNELVAREQKRGRKERVWLSMLEDVDKVAAAKDVDRALERLYLRAVARPWSEVPDDEKKLMRGLYDDVAGKHGSAQGWRAVCTAVFGSADYALY
ncbi:MAG: DUF1549 domain-containing protein [Deltaproteobacteria bacterium]|nr:DUF1549 domain-containing protein [Deltaproteobacteria bacterium]